MHKQFLEERAAFYATKIRFTYEKPLRAIIRSEESRRTFASICDILGKNKRPLSQVDIQSNDLKDDSYITLTNRFEVEHQIMLHNRKHSLQAHTTPFFQNSILKSSIDPHDTHKFDELLDGSFLDQYINGDTLKPAECEWILSIQKL
jgi:hypothetical protein